MPLACGAESVPRKRISASRRVAALISARRCSSRFSTGRQVVMRADAASENLAVHQQVVPRSDVGADIGRRRDSRFGGLAGGDVFQHHAQQENCLVGSFITCSMNTASRSIRRYR